MVAEKDRPVRRVRCERERDVRVDAVCEEADDRRRRDQSSDEQSAAITVARRGEETRVAGAKAARASVKAPRTAPPTEAQTAEVRAPSAGTVCGTAEKTRLVEAIRRAQTRA